MEKETNQMKKALKLAPLDDLLEKELQANNFTKDQM
jgi:hypothetical protein